MLGSSFYMGDFRCHVYPEMGPAVAQLMVIHDMVDDKAADQGILRMRKMLHIRKSLVAQLMNELIQDGLVNGIFKCDPIPPQFKQDKLCQRDLHFMWHFIIVLRLYFNEHIAVH